jgi:hypothetical protein
MGCFTPMNVINLEEMFVSFFECYFGCMFDQTLAFTLKAIFYIKKTKPFKLSKCSGNTLNPMWFSLHPLMGQDGYNMNFPYG